VVSAICLCGFGTDFPLGHCRASTDIPLKSGHLARRRCIPTSSSARIIQVNHTNRLFQQIIVPGDEFKASLWRMNKEDAESDAKAGDDAGADGKADDKPKDAKPDTKADDDELLPLEQVVELKGHTGRIKS
jgi:hypothetical protein